MPGVWCKLSALPTPHARLSPERWWQHHRFRRHVGERSCSVCERARGGWNRRLRRGRRVRLVIGESGFRPAGSVVRRSLVSLPSVSMLFRSEGGNTLEAPGAHADVGRLQRCFARGRGRQGGPSGFLGCIARSEPCCDAKPIGMLCVPMVPGVSCLAGSVGIAPWRQRRGRVPAGPRIGRAFRAADQRRWHLASADEPASSAGNRWRCRCIQPIGY